MSEYRGFLFSKLHLIGSKSEGPAYYLQQFDYSELPIYKQVPLWQQDPKLQEFLGSKVRIQGAMSDGQIDYESISALSTPSMKTDEPTDDLMVDMRLEAEKIWVNKMPPAPQQPKPFKIDLIVEWPHRSIWKGICPTTQIYDFFVEKDGEIVCQWSQDMFFCQVVTPVFIPGGSPHVFPVTCMIDPMKIREEGEYSVRGLFIAAGVEIEKKLQISIAE